MKTHYIARAYKADTIDRNGLEQVGNGVRRRKTTPVLLRRNALDAQLGWLEGVPVMAAHEDDIGQIGRCIGLTLQRDWWLVSFEIDQPFAADLSDLLRVGTPVSAGLEFLVDHVTREDGVDVVRTARLRELSLVARGAIPGAEIVEVIPPRARPVADKATIDHRREELHEKGVLARQTHEFYDERTGHTWIYET